ncbi:MAG: hypothetical protein JJE01_03490 [Gemmatimonadetes bacterium]|nr:hypothetical protein [Gemmatimonadota bacterium]
MLADEYLPAFDISDSMAVVVHADHHTTWEALMDLDLLEVGRSRPLVAALIALRMLPEIITQLLRGKRPPAQPERLSLRDTAEPSWQEGGWTLLAERPSEEIALGLIGRFWRPVISYDRASPEEFSAYSRPGYAKTVYALGVSDLDGGDTLLRAEMRTATSDAHARRWFRRYWTLGVGSGAHVLVNGVIETARDAAEARARQGQAGRPS